MTLVGAPPHPRPETPPAPSDPAFSPSVEHGEVSPQLLARAAVIAGGAGALSTVALSPGLQAILLVVFATAGVGSAVMCWLRLPVGTTIAGCIGLSVAAVTGVATQMVNLGYWHPAESCLALSATVVAIGLIRLWTLRGGGVAPGTSLPGMVSPGWVQSMSEWRPRSAPAALLLMSALGIWLIALPRLRSDSVGQYGLLATPGGVLLLLAGALAVTGFVVAVRRNHPVTAAAAVLIVIVVQRVTVSLITEVPIYAWTYKHIGVVDYIVRHGELYHPSIDIYRHWPGFFACMGWFSSITGLDLVDTAHWFAPVADVLTVAMVAALALSLGLTVRSALTAAMVAQLANWIGQDYYSPQGLALVMAVAMLALLVSSKRFRIAGYLSVLIFTVFVATHQLTPVWVCGLAVAMTLFGFVRPWWLPALYLLVVAVYVPPRQPYIQQYGWFTGFNPLENSDTTEMQGGGGSAVSTTAYPDNPGRVFTTTVEQGLSVSLWLLAAVCFLVVWRRAHGRWAAAIIAFSPMVLLLGQNYGGEAILRVYLYSLSGCALLIAPLLVRLLTAGSRRRRMLPITAAWLVLVGIGGAGMQGYFGAWSYMTITRNQVDQARWLSETTPAGTVMTSTGAPAGWPGRVSADYIRHALVDPWYDVQFDERQDLPLTADRVAEAVDALESGARSTGKPLYVVLPRQAWVYEDYMRSSPPGALDALVEQLDRRLGWTRVIDDPDTVVFGYGSGNRRS